MRKLRKDHPVVFTNDNLPTSGGISVVGAPTSGNIPVGAQTAGNGAVNAKSDEQAWRNRFEAIRTKLRQSQSELDIMQRELGELNMQYYANPQAALQQGYTRGDINSKVSAIDAKKNEIANLQQQLSSLEDALRRSGGDPGWARE